MSDTWDDPFSPTYVTADVVVCGGEWHGVEAVGVTYRQWVDAPGLVIIAQPEPEYALLIPMGSLLGMPVGDAGGAAWTDDVSALLEQPCATEQSTAPAPYAESELPATGVSDGGLVGIAIVLLVAGIMAVAVACWGGRAEREAEREAEADA